MLNSKHTVPHRTLFSLLFLFNLDSFLLFTCPVWVTCYICRYVCTFLQQSPYSITTLINILKRFKLFSIEFGYRRSFVLHFEQDHETSFCICQLPQLVLDFYTYGKRGLRLEYIQLRNNTLWNFKKVFNRIPEITLKKVQLVVLKGYR